MSIPSLSRLRAGRTMLRLGAVLLKAGIFLPLPLLAQSRTVLSVSIPFTFSVGKHAMPAGDYLVSRVADHTYALRSAKTSDIQNITVNNDFIAAAPADSRVVFRNYDGHYFLASFWFSGSRDGFKLPAGKAEKEMIAAHVAAQPDVLVAASHPAEPQP